MNKYKKIIGIVGLDKIKKNNLTKRYKNIKFIDISDKNFFSEKKLNALLVYAEWPIKKNLGIFLKKKYNFFKDLKWVHLSRAGIDEFNNYLKVYNFKFTCGKTIQGPNVSEHCIALLLYLTRGLYKYDKKKFRPTELLGKNVLIVGLGGIGINIAEKLNSFGSNISGVDSNLKPNLSFIKKIFDYGDLNKVIKNFDVIINATPLTKKTKNLFNKNIFKKMKNGVFFINVSRGSIVNTKDLKEYVSKDKFAGVGLDVIGDKDFVYRNPFKKFSNVVFSNHIAGITTDMNRRYDLLIRNFKRFITNDDLINLVDKKKGY